MKQYQKAMIIGGTGFLYQAAELVEQSGRVGQIELYFCNQNGFGKNQEYMERWNCRQVAAKKDLMALLEQETEETLVLSIMNPWLFTEDALRNPKLLVINLHHALLPAHRGRNAEAWAIYEGDEKAGVTWHKVDAGIDTGGIYLQKEVAIDDRATALKLLSQLNEAALEGLKELLQGEFLEKPPISQMPDGNGRPPHLSKDIPNGGWLDLSWDLGQMSRFLRAMDYGVINVFGKPKVRLADGVYAWKAWKMPQAEEGKPEGVEFCPEERELHIRKAGKEIILRKMMKMEDEA